MFIVTYFIIFFFFQAEDGIRDLTVTGVQTCALPILVWVVLPLCAMLPLVLGLGHVGLSISFTHAYFEAVSGLTTTGATVLTGLDALPVSINVWRTFLQWRSEEHTSELQSQSNLVCRLLL